MSMVNEIVNATIHSQKNLAEQRSELINYLDKLEKLMFIVNNALKGTQTTYDKEMLNQLSLTKSKVEASIRKTHITDEKLNIIRQI